MLVVMVPFLLLRSSIHEGLDFRPLVRTLLFLWVITLHSLNNRFHSSLRWCFSCHSLLLLAFCDVLFNVLKPIFLDVSDFLSSWLHMVGLSAFNSTFQKQSLEHCVGRVCFQRFIVKNLKTLNVAPIVLAQHCSNYIFQYQDKPQVRSTWPPWRSYT